MIDFAWGLPLGALAFYLYDSCLKLFDNEIVFAWRRGRWQAYAGSSVVLGGKRLELVTPYAPWTILIKATWHAPLAESAELTAADSHAASAILGATFLAALRPLQWIVAVLFGILVLAIPALSLLHTNPAWLLVAFALYYGLVLSALALVVARRRELSLPASALVSISADALLCAPFAANLVRKISLRQVFRADALRLAGTIVSPDELAALMRIARTRASGEPGKLIADQS